MKTLQTVLLATTLAVSTNTFAVHVNPAAPCATTFFGAVAGCTADQGPTSHDDVTFEPIVINEFVDVFNHLTPTFVHDETYTNHNLPTDTGVSTVPVPAAVWLFAAGLVGLVGGARRKV